MCHLRPQPSCMRHYDSIMWRRLLQVPALPSACDPSEHQPSPKDVMVRCCTRARAASRLACASVSSFETAFAGAAFAFVTPADFLCRV